jgi:hypothetical protein
MIRHEWRSSLTSDESTELAGLLQRASAYDAEPEYSSIEFSEVERDIAQGNPSTRHLMIWMLPHSTELGKPDEPERIAGLVRMSATSEHEAEVTEVIEPDLRSLGIMTLLLERIGLDIASPGGWLGTGADTLTGWARGNHPATGRLSNRFLIPRSRRIWKLIRSTESAESTGPATVLEPIAGAELDHLDWSLIGAGRDTVYALRVDDDIVGAVALDLRPIESEEFGACATIAQTVIAPTADTVDRRRLLHGAAAVARAAGLSGLVVYVDSDDADSVGVCRLAGFQHDRTDVCYRLGRSRC